MINEMKRICRETISDSFIGGTFKYYCNCCNHRVRRFLPYGAQSEVFTQRHIIGGGIRQTRCPICSSIDRWRWFWHVVSEHTGIFKDECTVLHFAPEAEISRYFRKCNHITYFTADKVKNRADCAIDITDIPFQSERFDYIIANHVLSYIKDEERAICEMKRCLKPYGKILLSFPICTDVDTYEDFEAPEKGIDMELFGTKDNVRMYGKDYKERFERYGLKICKYSPEDELTDKDIERLRLIRDDIILVCEKKI